MKPQVTMKEPRGPVYKDHALPQINMEAHKGPYIEDGNLIKGPLHFHVNLEEYTSLSCS